MFDPDTVTLMSHAPSLDGLDQGRIPQILTEAYAEIVTARIRLRDLQGDEDRHESVPKVIEKMRRLAFTQEAFVAVSEERENRASASFVAGAAHHACLLAESLLEERRPTSSLSFDGISPEVSATLLFLGAEASADAAEIAKYIRIDTDDRVEASVLLAIKYLATGRLIDLLALELPTASQIIGTGGQSAAVRALYNRIFIGIRGAAAHFLGDNQSDGDLYANPLVIFKTVQELCVESVLLNFGYEGSSHNSLYPGPLHLASLLSAVFKDFLDAGVVSVPPPAGIDGNHWLKVMRLFAKRRPYLWRNHRQAIAKGYLEEGTSSAVSFPTGAGKSTLSELKIAVSILHGKRVIFLVPTLSLVDQTSRAVMETFPEVSVFKERANDINLGLDDQSLPEISVLTPERCLAMFNFSPDVFDDIGLVVFDECHLLHPRSEDKSRRAVDAMMCILNLGGLAPSPDMLFLSAMMKNSQEIAGWLGKLTGRDCLSLDLLWKPTRQVRGCVVYGENEIKRLEEQLLDVRAHVDNKAAPKALRDHLQVTPFGFFCLNQTWQSSSRNDYSLLQLLDKEVTLTTGEYLPKGMPHNTARWYLTPNGLQVSAILAAEIAKKGLKSIVFVQTIPWAISANDDVSAFVGMSDILLSDPEKSLYELAADEAGGPEYLYLNVDRASQKLLSSSVCHHGHLMQSERSLHESLFKRADGLNVLVATSTLSQGMNLPGDVVIIGGDSRFDLDADKMTQMEAHELLNAAGRAGRAGERSHGFVLIVPSKVVSFNNDKSTIHKHWTDLKAIFSQGDQCLTIEDPMGPLLDRIYETAAADDPMTEYLIRRLPLDDAKGEVISASTKHMISRSLAAYQANRRGELNWVESRVNSVIFVRAKYLTDSAHASWEERLAAASGLPFTIIKELGTALAGGASLTATVQEWSDWFVAWLLARSSQLPTLIRSESLESFLGTSYKSLRTDDDRGEMAAVSIFELLRHWMSGSPLCEIERAYGTEERHIKTCEKARDFILDLVPELAYLFNLPAQVFNAMNKDRGIEFELPFNLALLGACVKEGFDRSEKLVLKGIGDKKSGRRFVHRSFQSIEQYLTPAIAGESYADAADRLRNAIALKMFLD